MSNNFALNRNVFDHHLFTTLKGKAREPYTMLAAWIWMIGNACYADYDIFTQGQRITLKRGQLSFSIRFLADQWLWEKTKVERFVNTLKVQTMIETSTATGQTIITICNYNEYQLIPGFAATPSETPNATAPRQHRDKEEYLNTLIPKKEYMLPLPEPEKPSAKIPERFEEFFAIFPTQRKDTRKKSIPAYAKALKSASAEEIIAGTRKYAESEEVKKGFAKGTCAWLAAERWAVDYTVKSQPIGNFPSQNHRPATPVKSRKTTA